MTSSAPSDEMTVVIKVADAPGLIEHLQHLEAVRRHKGLPEDPSLSRPAVALRVALTSVRASAHDSRHGPTEPGSSMSTATASRLLRRSVGSVTRWCRSGRLAGARLQGRDWVIPASAVAREIERSGPR